LPAPSAATAAAAALPQQPVPQSPRPPRPPQQTCRRRLRHLGANRRPSVGGVGRALLIGAAGRRAARARARRPGHETGVADRPRSSAAAADAQAPPTVFASDRRRVAAAPAPAPAPKVLEAGSTPCCAVSTCSRRHSSQARRQVTPSWARSGFVLRVQ
jgi:hypothetical protein